MTARGALNAHLDAELHIDPADIASPVQAAGASALSFVSGALLPMLAILLPPAGLRVPVTFVAVLVALGLTGALSAHLGGGDVRRAVLRVVIGGALGLAFTYGIGHLFGQPSADREVTPWRRDQRSPRQRRFPASATSGAAASSADRSQSNGPGTRQGCCCSGC